MFDRVRHIPLKTEEKVKSHGLLTKDILRLLKKYFPQNNKLHNIFNMNEASVSLTAT